MDLRNIFRNLVTNSYMADFDYYNDRRLSFDTVFYRTAYSHRCCICAYEHEFLEYLAEDGTINEQLYEQVVNNIIAGKCPHVDDAPAEYIKESCVLGIHIAAAVGTVKVLKSIYHTRVGIFKPPAYVAAAEKNNERGIQFFLDGINDFQISILSEYFQYAMRSENKQNLINIRKITLLELSVMKQNVALLKRILNQQVVPAGMDSALRLALDNNLIDIQDILLEYINWCSRVGKLIHTMLGAELIIAYDKPKMLEKMLKSIPHEKTNSFYELWFGENCDVLQRHDCRNVISKFCSSDKIHKPVHQRIIKLVYLLENFHEILKDKIMTAFQEDEECYSEFIKQYSDKRALIRILKDSRHKYRDPRVIKAFYDLGLDIDTFDAQGDTTITHLLAETAENSGLSYKGFREILSTLIQENPNVDLNESAVRLGIQTDIKLTRQRYKETDMLGEYICDNREHAMYNGDYHAFNFIAPYLIDAGFSVSTAILLKALRDRVMVAEEQEYIQQHIDTPRALMLRCRDVLRSHFKGRRLHAFLSASRIPKRLKNFILIKPSVDAAH